MKHYAVAIDGPAGTGKSTIVKIIADKMNFKCIDTGAMYRTVALKVLKSGLSTKNREDILRVLADLDMKVKFNEVGQVIYLDGENVNDKIRTPEVSQGSSDVAAIPEVRLKLVEIQREIAKDDDVIMDGRDIGTYVLPNAQVKIYLTASSDERARRRYKELVEKGSDVSFDEIKGAIEARDFQDMNREIAPLKPSEDAEIIDTTHMTVDEVVEKIMNLINNAIKKGE